MKKGKAEVEFCIHVPPYKCFPWVPFQWRMKTIRRAHLRYECEKTKPKEVCERKYPLTNYEESAYKIANYAQKEMEYWMKEHGYPKEKAKQIALQGALDFIEKFHIKVPEGKQKVVQLIREF